MPRRFLLRALLDDVDRLEEECVVDCLHFAARRCLDVRRDEIGIVVVVVVVVVCNVLSVAVTIGDDVVFEFKK